MDVLVKILVFIALGVVLLTANAWYVGLIYRSINGGSVVVAPIRIVGGPPGASDMGEVLARMLLVRLRSIMAELEQAQSSLERVPEADLAPVPGVMSTFFKPAKPVRLEAQLFEPTKIDVKVAGVEVGGLVPWFQSWFAEDRTLSFTVSLQDQAAIIAGNIDALDNRRQRPIWIQVEHQNPGEIVDRIAFALIQRAWATEGRELGELTSEEFRTLVQSVGKVSEINSRVRTFKMPAQAEYAAVLDEVAPLADRITNWNELTYFAATIAEGAEDNRRALVMYRRLKESGKPPIAKELLEQKLKTLFATRDNVGERSLEVYRKEAANAAEELSKLFGFEILPAPIELLSTDQRNVYWDGTKIHIPSGLEDIPDLVTHEMTYPFIKKLWDFDWNGQSGALASSYTDVLTSIVKQRSLHQTAEQADWTIAPGAVAWISGKALDGTDLRPLRSLKAPGTAYSDSTIGKDPQVAHFRDFVTTTQDQGGIHTNSGIPNKAFYETAMKIGTDKAARIWAEALKQFNGDMDFPKASRAILSAASGLYGVNSPETAAVRAAWAAVGL